jgi:FK506-binding nuclear protein
VIGGHTVHLIGNYVLDDLPDSDDEDEEDSEDDEMEYDTLDNMLLNADSDLEEDESEEDELDGLAHPRIMELDEDEDVPQLVKSDKKSKKRAAEEEADAAAGSSAKTETKKLKTNAGNAVAAGKNQPQETKESDKKEKPKSKKEAKKEAKEAKKNEQSQTNGKKVQFAEKLEQGPTPAKAAAQGPRNVNGVMVDDKKSGTGPAAKKGDKVGMRYIGKLKDGKVFDGKCCLWARSS